MIQSASEQSWCLILLAFIACARRHLGFFQLRYPLTSEHGLQEAAWAPPARCKDLGLLCMSPVLTPGQGVPGLLGQGRSGSGPCAGHLGLGCCALPREPQHCHSRAALRNPEHGLPEPLALPGTPGRGLGEEAYGAALPGGTGGVVPARRADRWRSGAGG